MNLVGMGVDDGSRKNKTVTGTSGNNSNVFAAMGPIEAQTTPLPKKNRRFRQGGKRLVEWLTKNTLGRMVANMFPGSNLW